MKNYRKHIDDFFREKLGRYKETPPDDVWEGLQGKLDTLKPYVPTSPFRWVWHFGMVSLIAVLSVSLTRKFTNKPAEQSPQTAILATAPVAPATAEQQAADATKAEQTTAQNALASTSEQNVSDAATAASVAQPSGSAPLASAASGSQVVKDSKRHSTASHGKAAVNRESTGYAGNKTAKINGGVAQQQLAYASTTGSVAKNIAGVNRAKGSKKEVNSKKKLEEYFSGSKSMAQLSAALDNVTDNNTSEPAATQTAQEPTKSSTLAAAPVKNIKKEITPEATKKVIEKVAEKKAEPGVKRFDFGVKAGYEQGFTSPSATKWVVAPYLQYHVAPKVSLMLQPGIKYATIAQRNVGKAQTYYSVNQDGKVMQNGTTMIDSIKVIATNVDTYYHTNYRYTQSHDSIVKTRTYGGSYVEFELPILLQYAVSKQVSVYGGVNLVYSKRMVVTENTYSKTGIQRSMDSTIYGTGTPTGLAAPQMSNVFNYTGNPYSDYQDPGVYPMKQENILRVGYMLGLSYEYSNRWLFDALIQHSPLKPNVKDGYNLNSSLSSPYFRISVGYKLTK